MRRLRRATRQTDAASRGVRMHGIPARLGGDEFVVLLTRLRRPEDADVAMYAAKSRGGGCSVVFNPPIRETATATAAARH